MNEIAIGDSLPELDMQATGDVKGLVTSLFESADELDLDVRIVDPVD